MSDIPNNVIFAVDVDTDIVTTFDDDSGNANGLLALPGPPGLAGDLLLACEHGTRQVTRRLGDSAPVVVADAFEGDRLNSPNDVTAADDGTLYFTDPPFGVADNLRELDFQGLYRVDPAGVLHLEDSTMFRPNGLALSLDGQTLFVADSGAGLINTFSVGVDGALTGRTLLRDDIPVADGLVLDDAGNLYVASSLGVVVIREDGSDVGIIPVPENPSNVAFADDDRRTLYITARTSLYRVRLGIPGRP